jgi:DNA-binding transcriptional MocR family regulator
MLSCCYILITNISESGKWDVKTLVLMQESGPVATGAGVPLHRQLFLVLHDEIARGVLAPGDALPTEQALCDQFGVSRITVRRALADLADQGYIERRQGVDPSCGNAIGWTRRRRPGRIWTTCDRLSSRRRSMLSSTTSERRLR